MNSKLSDHVDNLSGIYSKKNVKIKTVSQNVNLLDLKTTDYITNAKNAEKDVLSQKTD